MSTAFALYVRRYLDIRFYIIYSTNVYIPKKSDLVFFFLLFCFRNSRKRKGSVVLQFLIMHVRMHEWYGLTGLYNVR